jgi:hypothetical protein
MTFGFYKRGIGTTRDANAIYLPMTRITKEPGTVLGLGCGYSFVCVGAASNSATAVLIDENHKIAANPPRYNQGADRADNHPPPSALMSSTVAVILRPAMSTAALSFVKAIVCATITAR